MTQIVPSKLNLGYKLKDFSATVFPLLNAALLNWRLLEGRLKKS